MRLLTDPVDYVHDTAMFLYHDSHELEYGATLILAK
jgi:hypothetical protein